MTDEKIFASLESLIATLMQQSKIPSLAVAVVQDDKTIYSKAFGARTLKENKPASLDTLYGIGSCTKSFTCLALLQLTEQGKLKLTDPISKYLPFKIGFEDSPITIHHFMSHSSGIPNLGVASVIISRYVGKNETYIPMSSFEDIINHVNGAQNEIASKPGEKYFYNNSAYLLLGEIIAKVSGMSYEEYIKENILKPLGMTRSTFSREDFDQDADTMTAYFTEPDQDLIPSLHPFDQFIYSAGGLLSSVNELIKYLKLYFNDGKINDKQIISSDSIKKMFTPYIPRPQGLFGQEGYCYGWATIEDFFGETVIHHGGSTGVSSAFLALIPKKKLGIIILGNVSNSLGGLLSQLFFASFLGKNPQTDHPVLKLENKLSALPGEYQNYKGIAKLYITKKGTTLFGGMKEGEIDYPLIPETNEPDDYRFWIPMSGTKFPVEFMINQETGMIDLFIERNRYHKVSPIKKQPKKKEN